jgi:putative zinc finger protein
MKCPSEGELRLFVDGQLGRAERDRLEQHVFSCGNCGLKTAKIRGDSQEVKNCMAVLDSPDEQMVDPKLAYGRYRSEAANRKPAQSSRVPVWWRIPQVSAAGAALALVLLLSFTPVRTWGQRFLQTLRVQKLAVVPVDTSALMQAGILNGHARALSQLISDSVVVTIKPGEAVVVPDLATAAAKVGFKVESLDSVGPPERIEVEDEGAFHMTLDSDRIRAVLEEAGRSDIQVPDSISGSTVAVHVSKGVRIRYGNCGSGGKDSGDGTCIRFLQIPSPTVSVPPNLNMAALAEAGLQLAGLGAAEAKSFAQTVDWSSTLVIPVPQDKATYRTVGVDGVNGTSIEFAPTGTFRGSYAIIWVKDGIVHSLAGHGSPSQGLAAVVSLGS